MRHAFRSVVVVALLSLASSAFAEQIDNPEYTLWAKFKPGTYVTLTQASQMPAMAAPAGMPPGMDMSSMMPKTSITTKLADVKPDALTLEVTSSTTQMGRSTDNKTTRTVSAKIDRATTVPSTAPSTQGSADVKNMKEGKETLEINGKKVDAITHEYDASMNAGGRDATSHIKVWTSATFPGGTVKSETTTQIQQIGNVTTSMMVTDFNIVQ